MQAGQNPSDPLTLLNGYMGQGLMAGFNPFADMGLNTNAIEQVEALNVAYYDAGVGNDARRWA